MQKQEVYLGIDIGGTNTGFGLVDSKGQVLAYFSEPTHSEKPPETLFGSIADRVKPWLSEKNYQLKAIGVGAPNANSLSGCIENPPNLQWKTFSVIQTMNKFFDTPCYLLNDAKAATIAESWVGAGKDYRHFILLTMGTGLGAGIVIDGQLLQGSDGLAGELGHVKLYPNGRECGCTQLGCAETYISATALIKNYIEEVNLLKKEEAAQYKIPQDIDAKFVMDEARLNNACALKAVAKLANDLALFCLQMQIIFRPQVIILSGGLSLGGEQLLPLTQTAFMNWLPKKGFFADLNLSLSLSALKETKPGVIGAAGWALKQCQR